jgi:hypothetical protein
MCVMCTDLQKISFFFLPSTNGVNELKWTKIDVKTSTFLQFSLYLFMCCHFIGMWIMEKCAYWTIWILKNLKWVKKFPISKFGLNKGHLTISFNHTTFIEGPLVFIIRFISSSNFLGNRVLLDTSKKHSNFHIFSTLCLSKLKVLKKFMIPLHDVNVMQCICCLKKMELII